MTGPSGRAPAPTAPTVAVGIPCHNEAAAIEEVIQRWRAALPGAEIVIFDNDSSDDTGERARRLGVAVVEVPARGKGNAVRAMFDHLADRDALILVDGDGTYPAESAPALLEPVVSGAADMAVGARRPVAEMAAMTPVRGLGNVLIRAGFRLLIGRGPGDLLSGYRVLGRPARSALRLRATGFEIEAELASEAVVRGLRVVEVPVPYYPRIAGTVSKLNAVRDGLRIVRTLVRQSLRYRPWRLTLGAAGVVGAAAVGVGSVALGGVAAALVVLAAGLRMAHPGPRREGGPGA